MKKTDIRRLGKKDLVELLEAHGAPTGGTVPEMRDRLIRVIFIEDMETPDIDAVEMTGGAKIETVEVEAVEGAPADGGVEVITTQPGQMTQNGIVPAGTRLTVSLSKYSPRWMMPANNEAAQAIQKALAAKRGE